MQKRERRAWLVILLALTLGGTGRAEEQRPQRGESKTRPAADERRPERRPGRSLDDMIGRRSVVTSPSGEVVEWSVFREPVPYDEFMRAMQAEMGYEPRVSDASQSGAALCIPQDADYDGDGFEGAEETSGFLKGEYIADLPKVTTEFDNIWPGLEVILVENGSRQEHAVQVTTAGLEINTSSSEQLDFKNHFNSRTEIKLKFGLAGIVPSFSFDLGNTTVFETTRDRSYTWKREVLRSIAENTTRTITEESSQTYTIPADAGFVKGDVWIANRSDYDVRIDVDSVTVVVVAFSPFTGIKYTFGFGTLEMAPQTPMAGTLEWGRFNPASRMRGFAKMDHILRTEIEPYLLGGWVFDMEVAGNFVADLTDTGESIWSIQSRVSQKTARLSINYGNGSDQGRKFAAVSIYDEDGTSCITPRKALERLKQAEPNAELAFDYMEDGSLVVTNIDGVANRHADRDFDTLTEAEKDEYGRWVVGYDWGPRNVNFGPVDLEFSPLGPDDVIFFYYLTRADFDEETAANPDLEAPLAVANDGTDPSSTLVFGDVSPTDVIELDIASTFEMHQQTTFAAGNGSTSCGILYSRTGYGTSIVGDSDVQTTIPDVGYYGLELQFAGLPWIRLVDLLDDPQADASIAMRGHPQYDFQLRFTVTDAMTGYTDHQSVKIRQTRTRGPFWIGYTGYNVRGQSVDCRSQTYRGFFRNSGTARIWYDLGADADGDGSQIGGDGFYEGTDPDDTTGMVFAQAPEHLDGIDNDGDGLIDNGPMICPPALHGNQTGACRLDDRMGWYEAAPDVFNEYRWIYLGGGATPWISIGNVTEIEVFMPQDPTFDGIEVRTTYNAPGGGAHAGITSIDRIPDGSLPTFPTEEDIQAEDGRLVYPMIKKIEWQETYIHVPVDTTGSGTAEYRIDVPQGGLYRVRTRVAADDAAHDSFVVSLFDPDGDYVEFPLGTLVHFQLAGAGYGFDGFEWLTVGHSDYFDPSETLHPVTFELGPGAHTLRFQNLERGARLDRLRVERYCPDGDGDGWTTCAGDCNDANPNVRPGRSEVCSNGTDDDCDGVVDEGCGRGCGSKCPIVTTP